MSTSPALLSVRRLKVHYPLRATWPWQPPQMVRAVDDVHFDLRPGEALGIVGESGCGKSTLARALVGLQPVTGGGIVYQGQDLARAGNAGWQRCRRDIQMVFQDALASLDPGQTIAQALEQPLEFLRPELGRVEREAQVRELMQRVGLDQALLGRHPHQLSGGQCQRVAIARALAPGPRVLVCDEPVASLDPAARDQVLELLARLQRDEGVALVFVAHDLAAVRRLCQRVLVMFLGRIVEQASAADLFERPRHPYSRVLMEASGGVAAERVLEAEAAELPSPLDPPSGCVYRTRCAMADALCAREVPHLRRAGGSSHAACHYLRDLPEAATA